MNIRSYHMLVKLFYTFFVASALFLSAGCEAADIAEVLVEASAHQELPIAWAGPADAPELPRLPEDGSWVTLLGGSLITTDENGEAWLDIDDCLRIYLFQDSELLKASCTKSDYESGNETCALSGTAAFNNACASEVVLQTRGADVVLDGTWGTLTYLPEQQITLVTIAEGKATVYPVTNYAERVVSEQGFVVQDLQFIYTMPDFVSEPAPLWQLPPLMYQYDLEPWFERTIQHANEMDAVYFPPLLDLPKESSALVIHGFGERLMDSQVQNAILSAIDWTDIVKDQFPNNEPQVILDLHKRIDTSSRIAFDPDKSKESVAEAGLAQAEPIVILTSAEDNRLVEAGKRISDYLIESGFNPDLEVVTASELEATMNELQNAGATVLWLEHPS